MVKLNLPSYSFRFKNSENKTAIFDVLRKKFIYLTPEEWVRQHLIHYLLDQKKIPKQLLNAEKQVKVNGMNKRYDILAYKPDGKIHLVVECKAPSVKITQDTFDQIARYNLSLKADFLMVSNGLQHYYCKMNYREEKYQFLADIPSYSI
ncbi:type I restriction enzyme HsdR N-terminal domain-containing protein [Mesonia aquimarina]|uniref:type I restriction enzyme HsdR N-terminal domain-containing protein n=1 Tax=Mesonia aquimarina TaxID=1504967 RepID=UPI000EF5D623|nr:type I restriction enzyme HsdR N-terminal domain-containing protein [Mesonia aquimarina]